MIAAVVVAVGVMLFASGPLSRFVHEHPVGQDAGAVVPAADRRHARRGRLRVPHRQGVHLRGDARSACSSRASISAAAASGRSSCARPSCRQEPDRGPPRPGPLARERGEQPLPDLRRDPQRGVRLGVRPEVAVVVGAAGGDEPQPSRDVPDQLGPCPHRTCGSRPPGRAARPRPARASPRAWPAPHGSGQAPGSRRQPRWRRSPAPARALHGARSPATHARSIRLKASSTLFAKPAATSARAIVGRPSASSTPTWSSLDLGVDRQPDLPQQCDRPIEPDPPRLPLRGQRRLERLVRRIHPEPEDVELPLPQPHVASHQRVDLDPRDQRQPSRQLGGRELPIPSQRVVIGQREHPNSGRSDIATSAAGSKTPSDRVEWACRSTVEGPGGTTAPSEIEGLCRRERLGRGELLMESVIATRAYQADNRGAAGPGGRGGVAPGGIRARSPLAAQPRRAEAHGFARGQDPIRNSWLRPRPAAGSARSPVPARSPDRCRPGPR